MVRFAVKLNLLLAVFTFAFCLYVGVITGDVLVWIGAWFLWVPILTTSIFGVVFIVSFESS